MHPVPSEARRWGVAAQADLLLPLFLSLGPSALFPDVPPPNPEALTPSVSSDCGKELGALSTGNLPTS